MDGTWSRDDIAASVRRSGGRMTAAKRGIADVLTMTGTDLSAEEITQRVQSARPEISPSTVYRVLDEFEELGIVVHAHLGHGATVYHLTGAPHGHVVCTRCGTSSEVPAELFDRMEGELLERFGFALDRHHVAIAGLCATCRGDRGREAPADRAPRRAH